MGASRTGCARQAGQTNVPSGSSATSQLPGLKSPWMRAAPVTWRCHIKTRHSRSGPPFGLATRTCRARLAVVTIHHSVRVVSCSCRSLSLPSASGTLPAGCRKTAQNVAMD